MTTPLDTIKNAIVGVPFEPNKKPSKQGIIEGFQEMQLQLEGAQAGALVKDTLANLNALTSVSEASVMAWVTNDAVQANNGIYENTGTDVSPSWTRRTDIPQFAISGTNDGSGTARAIIIETDLPVPTQDGRCLIFVPVDKANTGNVTVKINDRSTLQMVSSAGSQIEAGFLQPNMIVAGFISGAFFRLITDTSSVSALEEIRSALIQTNINVGLTSDDAANADANASLAADLAIAAGAPLVTSLTTPVPANGTIELFKSAPGIEIFEVQTGSWVSIGWLGDLRFDNFANLMGFSGTFDDGTYIELRDGRGKYVATSGTGNLGQANAGGQEFNVVEGEYGLNVLAFGVMGDGSTDDTVNLQRAIDARGMDGTLIIPPLVYITSGDLITPSGLSSARLLILAYGALIRSTGATAILRRVRPTSASSATTQSKVTICGLTVQGDNTPGSHGFLFYTTYGLQLVDCNANNCDVGFSIVFGLMSTLKSCFATNCAKFGFHIMSGGSQLDLGSGDELAITNSSSSNSNSNGTVLDCCRVFALGGSSAQFKIEACEVKLRTPIAEGGITDYCFWYDNLNSNQSKGITIEEPHIECDPNLAVYKIGDSVGNIGGTYIIRGQDTVMTNNAQLTAALFDVASVGTHSAEIRMVENKFIPTFTTLVTGGNSSRIPVFHIDSVGDIDDWIDPAYWDGGTVGAVATVAPTFNKSNVLRTIRKFSDDVQSGGMTLNSASDINVRPDGKFSVLSGANRNIEFEVDNPAAYGLMLNGLFGCSTADNGYTTLGTVTGRMRIYDENKVFLGYLPIYDNIT